jgi:3-oxoacyl-[acyl-carrier protein] reductase
MTTTRQALEEESDHRRPRVLITGVEQTEGAHIARVLYAMGYHVVAHSFSYDAAQRVAAAVDSAGRRITPVAGDLTIEAEVDRLFTDLERRLGGIDALVHAAWLPGPETATAALPDIHPHDWSRFTQTHTAMLLLTIRRAVASFRSTSRRGCVVVVSGLGRSRTAEDEGARSLARNTIDGATEAFALAAADGADDNAPRFYAVRLDTTPTTNTVGAQIVDLLGPATPSTHGRVLLARALRATTGAA